MKTTPGRPTGWRSCGAEVRPEATTLVYTHPAFTVRQTIQAPIDEPGLVMLFDVDASRPLTISMAFCPDLSLMWPAGLMTGFVGFDAEKGRYVTGEETQRFYGVVGSPLAVDVSVQPYQEERQDVPSRFEMRITPEVAAGFLVPIVVAASATGRADATPLFVIVLADYWRQSGDLAFVREPWETAKRAFAFTAATDTDGNGLVENTDVGHGWVEGGALYPPHETLYLQALFVQAARDIRDLAEALGDPRLGTEADGLAETTLFAAGQTYWHDADGFYAVATAIPGAPSLGERRGPLTDADLREQDRFLDDARAQQAVTACGAAGIATDWGARILDRNSALCDPLSYHNGSVWTLFGGWTSMGAYRYARPHISSQALYANALLTRQDALGYVTELLSGDCNAAFGRSSHHQIWSEAMAATPIVREMPGLEVADGGRFVRVAPHLPIDWDRVTVTNPPAGVETFGLEVFRAADLFIVSLDGLGATVEIAPALPLDAIVARVTDDGREIPFEVVFELARAGTDVAIRYEPADAGDVSRQPRVLRSTASEDALRLTVEGRADTTVSFDLHTDRRSGDLRVPGVSVVEPGAPDGRSLGCDGPDVHAPRLLRRPARPRRLRPPRDRRAPLLACPARLGAEVGVLPGKGSGCPIGERGRLVRGGVPGTSTRR